MAIIFLIGRILFAGLFLFYGINHFAKFKSMTSYAISKKVPFPKVAVILTGLALIVGGLGILLWFYVPIAAALLALFLFVSAFMMHNFWADTDSQTKMVNMNNFMRNFALIGGLAICTTFYMVLYTLSSTA
ncbi:MAG: DoxX family protein [Candidatus Nomurabacteria bacterium]|nr:DoxX family protein [Candidatus Nomurabacteria bacterium]